MKLKIKRICNPSSQEWDQSWQNCDYATYFHSREWAEVWDVVTGGKTFPSPRMVVFSDDKKAIVTLSCIKKRWRGLVKEHISSPEGTYGGWISADNLQIEHSRLLFDYMLNECGGLYWRVNPFDQNILKLEIKPTGEETHILNLSPDFKEVTRKFSRGNISTIHKAQRHGITLKIASTLEDWQIYYQVYQNSLKRWGTNATSSYDWKLFEELCRRKSPYIRLWLALHDEKIISGTVFFYTKKHVVGWHGASLTEYLNFSPFNLLLYEIIKDACQNGFTWFDFNPSGGHKGVSSWKDRFGAETLNCPVYEVSKPIPPFYQKVSNLLYKIRGNK